MRPLDNFIGQERIKDKIRIILRKGQMQNKIPHMGIFGQAGQGKTTLANLITEEIKAKLIYINGTAIKNSTAFAEKIYQASKKPFMPHIVFIDEAHNLPKSIQDSLLSVLEEPAILCCVCNTNRECIKRDENGNPYKTEIKRGSTIEIKLPDNTSFILGTTHKGHLRNTVLSRLEIINLDEYNEEDAINILKKSSNIEIKKSILTKIVGISRSIRDLKRKLFSLEAYIKEFNINPEHLTKEQFVDFCRIEGIEEDGCTRSDIDYMRILHQNTRVGLTSMASMLCLSIEEVRDKIEPWLLGIEYIRITPKGRELTEKGSQRMGFNVKFDGPNAFELM